MLVLRRFPELVRDQYGHYHKTGDEVVRAEMEPWTYDRVAARERARDAHIESLAGRVVQPRAHRDSAAHDAYSFDFETVVEDFDWMMPYINNIAWDQMPPAPKGATTAEMQRARGFLPRQGQRESRRFVSTYRDDDEWLPRKGGNSIIVVCMPLYAGFEAGMQHTDGEGVPWRWWVIQCELVRWPLETADQLRRFQAKTGIRAKAQAGYHRDVMTPVDRLQRLYVDLDEARRDAEYWFAEIEDHDSAFQRELPMDPDVLYNATVISDGDGHGMGEIRGNPRRFEHMED